MTDNRAQFRKDDMTQRALEKASEKWPDLKESERYRRMIEQWLLNQDTGTSKTQKIADIDARLGRQEVMLSELANVALTSAERTERILQLLTELIAIVQEMKSNLAEHDLD